MYIFSHSVLNIGTSSQLSFQMSEGFIPNDTDLVQGRNYFPFFGNRYLAVAASLNGGNILACFVKMLKQWTGQLGELPI